METSLRKYLDEMDPPDVGVSDADMDYSNWPTWGNGNNMRAEAQRILDIYLPGRRSFLYTQNPKLNGEPIPGALAAHAALTFDAVDSNPASGTQEQEYITIKNSNAFAVDMSGWKIDGGVTYTFKPGTIIPPGGGTTENVGFLFVVRNLKAFRQRTTVPRAGQYCFAVGPYDGQLSGRGDTISLYDATGTLIARHLLASGLVKPGEEVVFVSVHSDPAQPAANFLKLHQL